MAFRTVFYLFDFPIMFGVVGLVFLLETLFSFLLGFLLLLFWSFLFHLYLPFLSWKCWQVPSSVLGLCLISWLPQWVADTAGRSCKNYSFSFLFRKGDLSSEPGDKSWLVQEVTVNNSSLPVICLRVDMWHSPGQWGTSSLGGRDFRGQLYKQTLVPLNKMWEYGVWSPGIYLVSPGRRPTGSIIRCCPGALI